MVGAEPSRGVVLVLMPVGRDAATVAGLIERAGLRPVVCNTLQEVVENLEWTVEVALVAEEALYGDNVRVIEDWVGSQPPWSDQPFIVLTNHIEGPKFAAFRRELVKRLRNVGFCGTTGSCWTAPRNWSAGWPRERRTSNSRTASSETK